MSSVSQNPSGSTGIVSTAARGTAPSRIGWARSTVGSEVSRSIPSRRPCVNIALIMTMILLVVGLPSGSRPFRGPFPRRARATVSA